SAANQAEPTFGAAVQLELRRSAAANHFDVTPQHVLRAAGAKRFHRRFLCREAAGKVDGRNATPHAVRDLAVGEDPAQEAFAITFDCVGNPIDFSDVDSQTDDVCHAEPGRL